MRVKLVAELYSNKGNLRRRISDVGYTSEKTGNDILDQFTKLLNRLPKYEVNECSCPKVCDCQDPPTHTSNGCPEHNDIPDPDPECSVHGRY